MINNRIHFNSGVTKCYTFFIPMIDKIHIVFHVYIQMFKLIKIIVVKDSSKKHKSTASAKDRLILSETDIIFMSIILKRRTQNIFVSNENSYTDATWHLPLSILTKQSVKLKIISIYYLNIIINNLFLLIACVSSTYSY